MGRKTRQFQIGVPYHVAHRGNHRQCLFDSDADRHYYLALMTRAARLTRTGVAGFCLMSNHVHFVVIPQRRWSISECFGRVHRAYSEALNLRRGRHGGNWEGRFFSESLDDTHALNALRYIERNPVKAGMVEEAWKWPWSSASQHCGDAVRWPLLNSRLGVMPPDPHSWRSLLTAPLSPAELETVAWDVIVESGAQMGSGRPQVL